MMVEWCIFGSCAFAVFGFDFMYGFTEVLKYVADICVHCRCSVCLRFIIHCVVGGAPGFYFGQDFCAQGLVWLESLFVEVGLVFFEGPA